MIIKLNHSIWIPSLMMILLWATGASQAVACDAACSENAIKEIERLKKVISIQQDALDKLKKNLVTSTKKVREDTSYHVELVHNAANAYTDNKVGKVTALVNEEVSKAKTHADKVSSIVRNEAFNHAKSRANTAQTNAQAFAESVASQAKTAAINHANGIKSIGHNNCSEIIINPGYHPNDPSLLPHQLTVVYCPAGKYMAGIRVYNNGPPQLQADRIYCCNLW